MTLEIQYNFDGTVEAIVDDRHSKKSWKYNRDELRRHRQANSAPTRGYCDEYEPEKYLRPIRGGKTPATKGGGSYRESDWRLDRNWEGVDDWQSLPVVKKAPKKERKLPMVSWWAVYTVRCRYYDNGLVTEPEVVYSFPKITSDWSEASYQQTQEFTACYDRNRDRYEERWQTFSVYLGKHRVSPNYPKLSEEDIAARCSNVIW